ncbi:hypothetical protein DFH09DRAFT_1286720 [Mycena vulgaris]|nr:hypothetical protein DFH09DRAFT_1286720 [Mycena vulgaris]
MDIHFLGSMIVEMLTSPSSDARTRRCLRLGSFAAQTTTSTALLEGIGKRLVQTLQRDLEAKSDFGAYSWIGSSALARINEHPSGIAAIVDADIQTHILDMTKSPNL